MIVKTRIVTRALTRTVAKARQPRADYVDIEDVGTVHLPTIEVGEEGSEPIGFLTFPIERREPWQPRWPQPRKRKRR